MVSVRVSGHRWFVKAEPADQNGAADDRLEAAVSAALPTDVPTPRLKLVADQDDWVLLGYEPVVGHTPPEPWQD